jgi:hypothetical protein
MAAPDMHAHLASTPPHGQFGAALSEAEVRRFQRILARDCGISVSLPEAWSRAIELLSLVEMLLQNGGVMPEGGELSTGVRASSLLTETLA